MPRGMRRIDSILCWRRLLLFDFCSAQLLADFGGIDLHLLEIVLSHLIGLSWSRFAEVLFSVGQGSVDVLSQEETFPNLLLSFVVHPIDARNFTLAPFVDLQRLTEETILHSCESASRYSPARRRQSFPQSASTTNCPDDRVHRQSRSGTYRHALSHVPDRDSVYNGLCIG